MTSRHSPSEFGESYDEEHELQEAIFDEDLGHLPKRELVSVGVGATVQQAIQAMNHHGVGCVVVVGSDGKLAGIFTERDVLTRVVDADVDITSAKIESVMTSEPHTLPHNASIAYALHHMSVEGYRHLPLLDDVAAPVAVVSVRDIISWIVEHFPDSVLNLPPTPRYPTSVDGG